MKWISFIKKSHRVLGLMSGLIVFIVSITGAVWVFKEELLSLTETAYSIIPETDKQIIALSSAKTIAQNIFPKNLIHAVLFKEETQPIEVIFYEADPSFYQSVYIDPYSGNVLEISNHFSGFFHFILQGHTRLWLPKKAGELIVAVGVLLFVLLLITGLIMWFPRNVRSIKNSLKFNWKPHFKWRRKNYDVHRMFGGYSSILLFVLGFTGLVMSLNWVAFITYKSIGGNKEMRFIHPNNQSVQYDKLNNHDKAMDRLLPILTAKYKDARSFEFHHSDYDSLSIFVEISYDESLSYNNDYRFYDINSLKEVPVNSIYGSYEDADVSDTILRMNYDIHIGTVLGVPTKILMFIGSMVAASLPVTGFLIWWGRRSK